MFALGGLHGTAKALAAIIGAILATAGRATTARPLAALPAYTFVGSAVAVEQCGYVPLLVDVDPHTWQLDAAAIAAHPRRDEIGLVLPVAPYGLPVVQAPWLDLRAATGIGVVIDAAAAFDTMEHGAGAGPLPVALSFHATKAYATGEGGAVFCHDRAQAVAVTRALNFGFYADRNSRGPSSNGKMSEYHAAVGHAELDGWAGKRAEMHAVASAYRERLAAAGLAERFHGAPRIGSNYALFDAGSDAARIERALDAADIGWRRWYGDGLHRQEHFTGAPRDALPVTESVATRLLGIPTAPDLTPAHVDRVVAALLRGLG
jgi:dTDP-4-amino-4,6-dideoxygalactose transaminase